MLMLLFDKFIRLWSLEVSFDHLSEYVQKIISKKDDVIVGGY